MKAHSDWQCLSLLTEHGADALAAWELYKACVSFAINGRTHAAESRLSAPAQALLEARRLLKAGRHSETRTLLLAWSCSGTEPERTAELAGDRHYVLGMLNHREGDPAAAEACLDEAAAYFRAGSDAHRLLRCTVNRQICRSTLDTYVSGELFFLRQKAAALGFHDLVGNIEKAKVSELLRAGRFPDAADAARLAVASYALDGCPEDRSVAEALLALALQLLGEDKEAEAIAKKIPIRSGKPTAYLLALTALRRGELPEFPAGHPLAGVPWADCRLPKENSIPGKILERLRRGAAERDDLIREVWGERAHNPSYAGRLYTAIKDLRGKYRIPVEFDGASYRLPPRGNA